MTYPTTEQVEKARQASLKDFNELLQKTVHTRELIDKSQSAHNLPTEPSKVKPPPHSHKGRR